jgi:hypothetical protein
MSMIHEISSGESSKSVSYHNYKLLFLTAFIKIPYQISGELV